MTATSCASRSEWAKRAGIDGFIVSWKSTPVLNRRLKRLAEVAAAERFKLLVIYQGLDFEREPLPAARGPRHRFVRQALRAGPAFGVFEKPLVIWSGTSRFTRAEMASVTETRAALAPAARLGAQRATATGVWPTSWTETPTTGAPSIHRPIPAIRRSWRGWEGDPCERRPVDRAGGARVRRQARRRNAASSSGGTGRPCGRSSTLRRGRDRTR